MALNSVLEDNTKVSVLNDSKNFLIVNYFKFIITLNIIPYSFPKYFVFATNKNILFFELQKPIPFLFFNAIIL
jgi:hypothetical protein